MNREEIYNEVIQDYSHLQYEYDSDELQDKINEIVDNIILETLTKKMFGEKYTFNEMSEREQGMIENEYNDIYR